MGQNHSKTTSFMSNSSYSEIFVTFDQVWHWVDSWGPKNPSFDPTIKMVTIVKIWISFSTTIQESKSELKWLRYLENRAKHISSLLETITIDPTVRISFSLVFWKLDIQAFLEIPWSAQSKFTKAFKYATKSEPRKMTRLLMSASAPTHPIGLWVWSFHYY